MNAHNLRVADPKTLWKHVTEEPTSINSKYQQKERSLIPLRVQPPRRSKFSAADLDEFPEPELEPVIETVPSSSPEPAGEPVLTPPPRLECSEPDKLPPIPENLPPLPETESETEPMSSVEDDIPLAELQRRWREEEQREEIEENLPLSELAEK